MCGIFAYKGSNNNAPQMVYEGLKLLEYRGYDSWGIAYSTKGLVKRLRHIGKVTPDSAVQSASSSIALGHTRWATHGGVTTSNTHPHISNHGDVVLVHNGIIENFAEIKQSLVDKGCVFEGETDSEVFANYLEQALKTVQDPFEAFQQVTRHIRGYSAIVALLPHHGDRLFLYKKGSPIVLHTLGNELYVASDALALRPYTNDVYYMEDGEYFDSETGLYDASGNKKDVHMTHLDTVAYDTKLGTFKHFMEKEIHEQSIILSEHTHPSSVEIERIVPLLQHAKDIYIIGAGSAYYAGFAGQYLFSHVANRSVTLCSASEFALYEPFLSTKSCVIALTQSGETIDLVVALKKAQEKGAHIVTICNTQYSTVWRMAEAQLYLGCGPEQCVVATKSYTAMVSKLALLAFAYAQKLPTYRDALAKVATALPHIFHMKHDFDKVSEHLARHEHIFLLGKDMYYPLSLEGALKIKEVSYIHAEGFASGELKHGVIALIDEGTPVIGYAPSGEYYDDIISALHEVKARGAYIVGLSDKQHPLFDIHLEVPKSSYLDSILYAVAVQYIAYYIALARNLDPDKPRNLAKSVTVK